MPTKSFLAGFAKKVRYRPGLAALSSNGQTVTYRELDALVRSALSGAPPDGLPAGRTVCVVGKKSPLLVATLIACFTARWKVLLPPADLGEAALRELCAQVGCSHLVTVDQRAVLRQLTPNPAPPAPSPLADGPGLLLTTPGSTGLPMVVPLSSAGVDRFFTWAASQFEIGPGAVVLSHAPLNVDLSLLDVWTALDAGACTRLVAEDVATDGARLLDQAAGATVVHAVPRFFRLVTGAAQASSALTGTAGAPVLPAARHVVATRGVLRAGLLARMRRLFPAAALYNLYGCTETNGSFLHRLDAADAGETADATSGPGDGGSDPDRPLPIGHPLPGADAAVVDAQGAPLTGAATGELVLRTPFQSAGYLDPELDRGRFVPAPPGLPPGRYHRTGHLVRRAADGTVAVLGAADVPVPGVRVATGEVEAISQHDGVLEAAVPGPSRVHARPCGRG